jgi:hypothetical protein
MFLLKINDHLTSINGPCHHLIPTRRGPLGQALVTPGKRWRRLEAPDDRLGWPIVQNFPDK